MDSPLYTLANWKIKGYVEEGDPCFFLLWCRDDAKTRLLVNGDYYLEDSGVTTLCNYETKEWELALIPFKPWIETNVFNFSCVDELESGPVTTPPAPCACRFTLLDSSNAQEEIGDQNVYKDSFSKFELIKPTVTVSGCPNTPDIDCNGLTKIYLSTEGEYVNVSRVHLDCEGDRWDAEIWQPGSWNIYTRHFYFTCIDWGKPLEATTPEPPGPITDCGCPGELIDEYNAKDLIGHYDIYLSTFSKYQLIRPTVTGGQFNFGSCRVEHHCPENVTRYILGPEGANDFNTIKIQCFPNNKMWQYQIANSQALAQFDSPYVFMLCVDYNSPKPTVLPPGTPICDCPHSLITHVDEPEHYLVNWKIEAAISEDHCQWVVSCKDRANQQIWLGGQYHLGSSYNATCNVATNTWSIDISNLWISDQPSFNFSCIAPIVQGN